MKAYVWSTNDGNASWTVNGSRQGTKQASGKIENCSNYYYYQKQLFDRGTQTANRESAAVPVREPQGLLINKFIQCLESFPETGHPCIVQSHH